MSLPLSQFKEGCASMSYTYLEANENLDIETPLVTKAQVLLVSGDEIDDMTDPESVSFINTAHVLLVTILDGYSLPNLVLIEIEKYLAAHYATLAYPSIQRERLSVLTSTIVSKIGLGLQNTRYGQGAISLDPTGRLQEISDGKMSKQVKVTSLGNGVAYDW